MTALLADAMALGDLFLTLLVLLVWYEAALGRAIDRVRGRRAQ